MYIIQYIFQRIYVIHLLNKDSAKHADIRMTTGRHDDSLQKDNEHTSGMYIYRES